MYYVSILSCIGDEKAAVDEKAVFPARAKVIRHCLDRGGVLPWWLLQLPVLTSRGCRCGSWKLATA